MKKVCSLCGRHKFFTFGGYKDKEIYLCTKCWPYLCSTATWFEDRYSVLQNCIGNILSHKIDLFKPLGLEQSHMRVEDGEWLTERVIEHLGLLKGEIQFKFKQLENNIGGTVQSTGTGYLVEMSQYLQDNYRALSAILIHELMHIYLANHSLFYKNREELEEITDLSCVLLGFGIPMINAKQAWDVDRKFISSDNMEKGTSYHVIGYLSEEKIGYAFAYFMANNGIHIEDIKHSIDPQCWCIILDGIALEKKYREALMIQRKARQYMSEQFFKKDVCEFSCPACFLKMAVPRETLNRIGIFKINCRKCGSEIHFDGTKIVQFKESIK